MWAMSMEEAARGRRGGVGRIDLRVDASDHSGRTWRMDLDYIFEPRRDDRPDPDPKEQP